MTTGGKSDSVLWPLLLLDTITVVGTPWLVEVVAAAAVVVVAVGSESETKKETENGNQALRLNLDDGERMAATTGLHRGSPLRIRDNTRQSMSITSCY